MTRHTLFIVLCVAPVGLLIVGMLIALANEKWGPH